MAGDIACASKAKKVCRSIASRLLANDGGKPVTYRAGDIFNVSAGSSHTEEIGAEGVRIVVGRKH
jgi:uncharacterized cupin superfamily protein